MPAFKDDDTIKAVFGFKDNNIVKNIFGLGLGWFFGKKEKLDTESSSSRIPIPNPTKPSSGIERKPVTPIKISIEVANQKPVEIATKKPVHTPTQAPSKDSIQIKKGVKCHAYVDAVSSNNLGAGAYAIHLSVDGQETRAFTGFNDSDNVTNNKMALLALLDLFEERLPEMSNVKISISSSYIKRSINQYLKDWIKNDWNKSDGKPIVNKDLWLRLNAAMDDHQIEWDWTSKADMKEDSPHGYKIHHTARRAREKLDEELNAEEFSPS